MNLYAYVGNEAIGYVDRWGAQKKGATAKRDWFVPPTRYGEIGKGATVLRRCVAEARGNRCTARYYNWLTPGLLKHVVSVRNVPRLHGGADDGYTEVDPNPGFWWLWHSPQCYISLHMDSLRLRGFRFMCATYLEELYHCYQAVRKPKGWSQDPNYEIEAAAKGFEPFLKYWTP